MDFLEIVEMADLKPCSYRKCEYTPACGGANYWWCYQSEKNCQINIYKDCKNCEVE